MRAPPGQDHPRSVHRVGGAVDDGPRQLLAELGRVLAVAVHQDGDVRSVLRGPAIGRLLVAAVAEVDVLADDLQRDARVAFGPFLDQVTGVVAAGVIGDEDQGSLTRDPDRDPVEHVLDRVGGLVGDDGDGDQHWRAGNLFGGLSEQAIVQATPTRPRGMRPASRPERRGPVPCGRDALRGDRGCVASSSPSGRGRSPPIPSPGSCAPGSGVGIEGSA